MWITDLAGFVHYHFPPAPPPEELPPPNELLELERVELLLQEVELLESDSSSIGMTDSVTSS